MEAPSRLGLVMEVDEGFIPRTFVRSGDTEMLRLDARF
jgi:hypothetical protein